MNILLTNSSNMYGGGEFYVLEVAKELTRRKHNVMVSCKPDNLLKQKCDAAGVRTIPVDFPVMGKLARFIQQLKDIVKREHIEIVHTNTNYDRTAGAFAARLAGAKHVTNVHSFHSLQYNLTHIIRNKWATDHFLVDGICVKELLVIEDKIAPEKISVVYLGVDPESMKNSPILRKQVRDRYALTDEHIVIGNVGRLVPMKGQQYLVESFGLISAKFPNARLLLVGDGELLESLQAKSKQLGIIDKVVFAGFSDDLVSMYSSFDLYAHSSVEGGGETFPFAVLQALSQELPVVITKVGDVPAMVDEGVNGFVVEEKNTTLFAERLSRLLVDETLRRAMSQASRKRLLKLFTTGTMVDGIEKVYESIKRK